MSSSAVLPRALSLLFAAALAGLAGCDSITGGGDEVEPLTTMEEGLVGKWTRYHAYDGSTQYFVFRTDRTACYFERPSSGGRINEYAYSHWELDEASPVGSNRFRIVMTYEGGGTSDLHVFAYGADRVYYGGYDNLAMAPSATSEDC